MRGYKELSIPIIDADGTPAWPELFPLDRIDRLRESVGPRHFSSQMMLECVDDAAARLDPGALKFYGGELDFRTAKIETGNESDPGISITGAACYWDPSGGRAGSDASVCVLVCRDDKNRRAFIHDVRYLAVSEGDPHPLATQCDAVLDFMQSQSMRKIAVEVNGIGNALPEIIRESAKKKGYAVMVQRITNHQNKETRILDSIEPLLATGRLYAHERIARTPLLSEMQGWSPEGAGSRDDGLDAVAGALRMIPFPIRPLSAAFRILKAETDFKL